MLAETTRLPKTLLPIKGIIGLASAGVLLFILSAHVTPYMLVASAAYMFMVSGLFLRKQKKVHVPLMASAIFLDLTLVLILEIQRNAVKTALAFTLGPLQQLHIGFSTVAVLFYIPILFLGIKRLRGKGTGQTRKWHMRLGIIGFVFRTLGFVMMFSLLYQ